MSRRYDLPYGSATSGGKALEDLHKMLGKFGCSMFGTAQDIARSETIVHFEWRGRRISLAASWKGYAEALLRRHPIPKHARPQERQRRLDMALEQAKLSVCSVLRDWVKGQITAVECGVMSFEAAFMPHMLLSNGEKVIDHIHNSGVLPRLTYQEDGTEIR